jgi:hypothetical protein
LVTVAGTFAHNTLVANSGFGESASSGGGLILDQTPSSLTVEWNIVAYNQGSGIACNLNVQTQLGVNLLWENSIGDIGGEGSTCPLTWLGGQLIADPLFCNPATDDYHVASDSPALTGDETMGAYPIPGCGPGVPVRPITWGRVKALYR